MKDKSQNGNQYITKKELATRMNVTARTIDTWMARALVPYRKIGRTVRFDWAEVQEHLAARCRPAVAGLRPQPGPGIAATLRQRAAEIRKAEAQRHNPH